MRNAFSAMGVVLILFFIVSQGFSLLPQQGVIKIGALAVALVLIITIKTLPAN